MKLLNDMIRIVQENIDTAFGKAIYIDCTTYEHLTNEQILSIAKKAIENIHGTMYGLQGDTGEFQGIFADCAEPTQLGEKLKISLNNAAFTPTEYKEIKESVSQALLNAKPQ